MEPLAHCLGSARRGRRELPAATKDAERARAASLVEEQRRHRANLHGKARIEDGHRHVQKA